MFSYFTGNKPNIQIDFEVFPEFNEYSDLNLDMLC